MCSPCVHQLAPQRERVRTAVGPVADVAVWSPFTGAQQPPDRREGRSQKGGSGCWPNGRNGRESGCWQNGRTGPESSQTLAGEIASEASNAVVAAHRRSRVIGGELYVADLPSPAQKCASAPYRRRARGHRKPTGDLSATAHPWIAMGSGRTDIGNVAPIAEIRDRMTCIPVS